MNIETKEIGISIGIDGNFQNTEYTNNNIHLKRKEGSINNKPIYESEGYWESDVIDLVDKFKEYDNIALSKTQGLTDNYVIETRTSDDNINFNNYTPVAEDGKVLSPIKRFIQIKIKFYAGYTSETIEIAKFDSPNKVDEWENNNFIETDNGLRLKRNYEFDMNKDSSWAEEGSLHRKSINKNEWKAINSIVID